MGRWEVYIVREVLIFYIVFIQCIQSTNQRITSNHRTAGSTLGNLSYPVAITLLRNKRAYSINNIVSNILKRTNRDSLLTANVVKLNIETDDVFSKPTISSEHPMHAQYERHTVTPTYHGSKFKLKWRDQVSVEHGKNHKTMHSTLDDVKASTKMDLDRLNVLNHTTTSNNSLVEKSKPRNQSSVQILKTFLRPSERNYGSILSDYITTKLKKFHADQIAYPDLADERDDEFNRAKDVLVNTTERQRIEIPSKTIFSFFAEENKRPLNEVDEFTYNDDSDHTNDEDNDEESLNDIQSTLVHHNIPILSGLIHGTLDKDMDAKNLRIKEYIEKLKNNSNGRESHNLMSNEKMHSITPSIKMDLEDPADESYTNKSVVGSNSFEMHNLMPTLMKTVVSSKENEVNNKAFNNSVMNPTITKYQTNSNNNKTNENNIDFITINNTTNSSVGVCMDGSPPGYYLRKGFGDETNKWIIHLHGGAWCYDLRTCMKRRKSILGSTNFSHSEDMNSFFHGILSKSSKVNPIFFKWNVIVLSYCDGGLFSGNRKRPLTGKGKNFYFQGRSVLKSLIEQIKKTSLSGAKEIILSGTSAGGLAVVLQGDFIRRFIPRDVKVKALVDAGIFLDQKSILGDSLVRQQFRALYSLHKPILNKDCVASVSRKDRYMCLFPEKTFQYMKLPVFVVNSLYDHWQLSYLVGISCVYDNQKCETEQHDRILAFRNNMFTSLRNMTSSKNSTGIFANSCFAHGQVIIDYTWTKVKVNGKSIAQSFYEWYSDKNTNSNKNIHFLVDCKYPCNGSCAKPMAERCVTNFKAASENRRKRDSEIC